MNDPKMNDIATLIQKHIKNVNMLYFLNLTTLKLMQKCCENFIADNLSSGLYNFVVKFWGLH